jgi:hypothetical protein
MDLPIALGYERLDVQAEELGSRIPKQPLGLFVDEHDSSVSIDDYERVRRRLDEVAHEGLAHGVKSGQGRRSALP